ncbi:MAG: hypothetical protein J6I71_01975 [Campylobacter sp.]|uniref:hypothetical protein n=1 Tax=Campylobacter sp. TaxID=205 RepID=UPI001B3E8F6A|nr:hypothetical protein [Campylobacter sp.]MBP3675221.1 hypothetical protein [Campylobacter sp.]
MITQRVLVVINDQNLQMSKENLINSVIKVLNDKHNADVEKTYIAEVFNTGTKETFYVADDTLKAMLRLDTNVVENNYATKDMLKGVVAGGSVELNGSGMSQQQIQTLISQALINKVDRAEVYSKDEVDEKVATAVSGGSVSLDGYVREEALDALATKDELNAKLDSSTYTADKATYATKDELGTKANSSELALYTTKDELSTLVYTKSEVDEKVATVSSGGSVSLDGFVRVDDIVNLATKDEVNAKLDSSTYTADKATYATKDELNSKADRSELDTKANSSDILNLATKAELANLATKDELQEAIDNIPTGGSPLDTNELQTAITSNETITNLSNTVANLASNMQGATYAQVAAMLNYSSSGASLPASLAIYSDYSLKERSGDTVVKIKIKECLDNSYAALSELKLYGSDGKQYVMHSYTDSSLTNAKLVYKAKDDGVVPELSGVSATSSDWSKADDEIEVDIKATSAYSGFNVYRIGARFSSDSGWCSASSAANKDEVTITIKDFTPAKLEIRTGYANNTHLITKSSFVVSAGELYGEELAANEGNKSRVISLDFNKMNLNLNGDKYVELAKAWNIVPSQYEPNYTIGQLSDLIGEVSGDKPFKFTLKGIAIHSDSYGTGITNVEFFNHEGARLYPKYVQVTSGDNVATFILTKNEGEKTEVANTIPTDYDYEAADEYKVIAKRISPQYGGSYLFEKMVFYTAAGGYNNEYLTGSGLVHLEFECSFVPAKVQYIQSPYGHGKATGYDILVDDVVVSTVMYAGGSYDYETHDLANAKVKVPKEA